MQAKILDKLCCPVDKNDLELIVFDTHKKKYRDTEIDEVNNGILLSKSDWIYPIINGIPRMHLYSFLEHEEFLKKKYKDFETKKSLILDKYYSVLNDVLKKTKKTRKSFG